MPRVRDVIQGKARLNNVRKRIRKRTEKTLRRNKLKGWLKKLVAKATILHSHRSA